VREGPAARRREGDRLHPQEAHRKARRPRPVARRGKAPGLAGARPGSEGHPAATRRMTRFFISSLLIFLAGITCVTAQNPSLAPALGALQMGDYAQAIDWLEPLAKKGDTEAMFLLARAYEEAPGSLRSLESAHAWYLRTADQGNLEAQI